MPGNRRPVVILRRKANNFVVFLRPEAQDSKMVRIVKLR
jgi:hypothetical protein